MSPLRRSAVGLALAAVAVFASAVPASAHDQLVSSTPGDGEQLASAPSTVSMTFSGELLVLDSELTGAVVLVVDESGTDWVTGPVTVAGNTVTAPLDPEMPVAGYQVRWQVVSEDGHPISGVIPFTIGDAEPMPIGSTPAGEPDDGPDATPSTPAADQIADETGGATRVLLVGAGGAAVAALAFVLYRILRRPRTTDEL
ncbi:copper resistance protein CopC [Microbacterium foliorum]|uniref:Copper transport protein YcnJ n=1 Tax=Microbacterium foliorum TaxID=104336 RepID=A0A0F0KGV1_9MICO|nr:copper resistance CopC family protein [Microbacterium foliorum]AXL12435.1 copper resistance protein CopC [Microbacterium foliorum]KJL20127.1 Copper transport protein YcnJ precursor [Microbacterium foliorum]CAH0196328.1 Copper transport protein YcnJ [Microbacterium foliorum]CAH0232187.1 Copper transport protein YcnJ [Microbacterium foliorum]